MTARFRNVAADPAGPVEGWPAEAVRAAVERGDLADWRRLAAAVRAHPFGGVARAVVEIAATADRDPSSDGYDLSAPVALLLADIAAGARAEQERSEREAVAGEVRRLVARSGLGRAAFAAAIGTSPSRLSTYATGRVIPSAALMVRMRRCAGRTAPASRGAR